MLTSDIHIVLASDNAYVQHLGVLLVSIFENNREESVTIHLLADNISEEKKQLLARIVGGYGQQILFYDMDKSLFRQFPLRLHDHISIASYYRLKLADLLPAEVSRILYLDCDMIVTGRLRPLWETDLDGVAVAAVTDPLSFSPETFRRLGLSPEERYFNAGMLLINVDHWRQRDVFGEAVQIADEKSDALLWHDQDILNLLFHTKWRPVPFRWNLMNTLMRPAPYFTPELVREIDEEVRQRVIVHYTCRWKPWLYPCDNPLRFEYYRYLDRSPWKGFKPRATPWQRFKEAVRRLRIAVGLLQRGYREIEF